LKERSVTAKPLQQGILSGITKGGGPTSKADGERELPEKGLPALVGHLEVFVIGLTTGGEKKGGIKTLPDRRSSLPGRGDLGDVSRK